MSLSKWRFHYSKYNIVHVQFYNCKWGLTRLLYSDIIVSFDLNTKLRSINPSISLACFIAATHCSTLNHHWLLLASPAHLWLFLVVLRPWSTTGSILSVESNQNVESKTKNVESKTEKYGVQNNIFSSRNQLFWALTHLIQYNLHSVLPDLVAITQYYAIS